MTITPTLTTFPGRQPGNGICLFFYDGKSEFYPGGIGSALGYTMYTGPLAFNYYYNTGTAAQALYEVTGTGTTFTAAMVGMRLLYADGTDGGTITAFTDADTIIVDISQTVANQAYTIQHQGTVNGLYRSYLGIGFDVKGDFGTTYDSKTGHRILGTDNDALTSCAYNTLSPNAITTRAGELSSYKVISTTPNLSTYPLSGTPDETYGTPNTYYADSPGITLHQSVTSRDDIKFTRVKVVIQNSGKRVRVEMKDDATGKYYPYQIIDLDSGLGERQIPFEGITTLRTGIAFSTSDSVMNCEIKNFSTYGIYSGTEKTQGYVHPHSTAKYRVVVSGDCP